MSTETIDTKTVTGRRDLHYDSLEEVLADAERLAAGNVTLVGNWSLRKIFGHLARTITFSLDGFPFTAPWLMRFLSKRFFKKRFLTKSIPSGFQIPKKNRTDFIPDGDETETGLSELRSAIARFQSATNRVPHPFLGELTLGEWQQFHCRHAELHMSFAVPQD